MHRAAECGPARGRLRRSAGGEQVVDDQHPLPLAHRVVVNLERVGAVLERVVSATVFDGSLPGFRTGTKPAPRRSATAAEDEAAALDADDQVDGLAPERRREASIAVAKARRSCSSVVMS